MHQAAHAEQALRSHHLPRMRKELQLVLLVRCLGFNDSEAAELAAVSASTVRRRLDMASSEVFDTLPVLIPRGSRATGFWVALHLTCCLGRAAAELGITQAGAG